MRTIGTGVAFCFFIGFAIQVYKTDCMFSAWGDTREISTSLCNLITSRRAMIAATVGLGACGLLYCTYRYMSSGNSSTKDVLFTPTPFDREARNALDRIMLYDPVTHEKSVEEIARQEANLLWFSNHSENENTSAIMKELNWGSQNTYIAVNDVGNPAGFIHYFASCMPGTGKIFFLATRASERKKGYGSKLIQYAIDDLLSRNISTIFLNVQENNPAKNWYTKIGFVFSDEVEFANYVRGNLNITLYQNYKNDLSARQKPTVT